MTKQLYICNNANTDHCNKLSQKCAHKIPHEKVCTKCCDLECTCEDEIGCICTIEEECNNGTDAYLRVKCIPIFNDFIEESEMLL